MQTASSAIAAESKPVVGAPVLMLALGAIIGMAIAEFAGTGGLSAIAEPFSPIRNQEAVTWGAVGAGIGLVAGLLVQISRRKSSG